VKKKRRLDVGTTLTQAKQHFSAGRQGQASALVDRILAAAPDNADARRFAAMVALADERYDAVLDHLGRVGAKDDAWLEFAKARALFGLGRLEEAEAPLRRSRDLDPADPGVYELEAMLRRAQGDAAAALDALSGALALEPRRASALAMKADLLFEQGRGDEALEAFRSAVRSRDESTAAERAELLARLAAILDARGEAEEASAARRLAEALSK
jgi:tetratricopeptide (TPR) repeat protein